ncbi:MAG: GTP 3',8-cyclase MoaA [Actinomycetes bacterium]
MLADGYGRIATDLRVSLTDRCNLRCTYCMPEEGLAWLPREETLTDDELVRVIRVAVSLGVTDVRLTGGEPLLRRNLVGLVARLADLDPRPRLSMTTNGIGLARLAAPLAEAGLDRVNVSLDTLRPERFLALARRDRHADVLAGLAAAASAGLTPVKVNTVLMRGINDDEPADLLRWALDAGYELRFIEQMPLDAQHAWQRESMVTAEEILADLARDFTLVEADAATRGSAPAEKWQVSDSDGRQGVVGVIASVTRPFCGACDRVRLTADGQLRNCLFARQESDLRRILRGQVEGSSGSEQAVDEAIAQVFLTTMAVKRPGHGIDDVGFLQPDRPMSAIGG